MDWKNELPVTIASTLGSERQERIDDEVCSLLYHFGPDRHIDGHEDIARYICGLISEERKRCAEIARDLGASIMCIEDDDDDSPAAVGAAIAAAIEREEDDKAG